MITGPDNQCYVVPQFSLPALQLAWDSNREKGKLDIEKAGGTVSIAFSFGRRSSGLYAGEDPSAVSYSVSTELIFNNRSHRSANLIARPLV